MTETVGCACPSSKKHYDGNQGNGEEGKEVMAGHDVEVRHSADVSGFWYGKGYQVSIAHEDGQTSSMLEK